MEKVSFELQERDKFILRELLESRIATLAHLAQIHFAGKSPAAKKRIYKIKAAGLIAERPRKAYEPGALFLTRKGIQLLHDEGFLFDYPPTDLAALERRMRVSDKTVRHELEVMDVKAAFHAALRGNVKFEINRFITWPLLIQFKAFSFGSEGDEAPVQPDGYVHLLEKEPDGGVSERCFFLEVDRSNESQEYLTIRAERYFDHYKSGGFAMNRGASRSAYNEHPFRVLMVFKTAERRNNTAERLIQNTPPILHHTCLTTLAEVLANPLGPIWLYPSAYRKAVAGTQFDTDKKREAWGHKRQSPRELFVERTVEKFSILGES